MKSLIKKTTWILPLAVLLFSCGGNDKKKAATTEVAEGC